MFHNQLRFDQMRVLSLLAIPLCLSAIVSAERPANTWPFIIVRHADRIQEAPETMKRILQICKDNPGSVDEIWLADSSYRTPEALKPILDKMNVLREQCDDAGIQLSFQQGITLGHSGNPAYAKKVPGTTPFSEKAWRVNEHGHIVHGLLCPRSPESRQHLYLYAKTILEGLKPNSYWLDDDLRIGLSKPCGCFCDLCLSEFNAKHGSSYTREQLASILFSSKPIEPLREKWIIFNEESLAGFAMQLRRAAEEVHPECRLAYQSIMSSALGSGRTFLPLLEALSGPSGKPVGIRPGALFYDESIPRDMTRKSFSVAREAERCRKAGYVAQIAYENETYPRHILQKSPEAIMIECSLMVASGCDSISLYWYVVGEHEPIEYYENFAKTTAQYRPYLERIAASTRKTRLGGMARALGSNRYQVEDFSLFDPNESLLAHAGLAVTVEEADPQAWILTMVSARSIATQDIEPILDRPTIIPEDVFGFLLKNHKEALVKCLPDAEQALPNLAKAVAMGAIATVAKPGDEPKFATYPIQDGMTPDNFKCGAVVLPTAKGRKVALVQPIAAFPLANRRRAYLDVIDIVTDGAFPVRLETCHAARVLPRIDADGKVDSVTLLNHSIGETPNLKLTVRNPRTRNAQWLRPRMDPVPISADAGSPANAPVFTLPVLPGWQPGTLIFVD